MEEREATESHERRGSREGRRSYNVSAHWLYAFHLLQGYVTLRSVALCRGVRRAEEVCVSGGCGNMVMGVLASGDCGCFGVGTSDVGISACAACLVCGHLRYVGTLGMLVPKVLTWTSRGTLGVWLSRVCTLWWLDISGLHLGCVQIR